MTAVNVTELTSGTLEGEGIFDALMKANKAHLDSEFKQSRIKGPEYATVYLGALQATMQASLTFLSQRQVLNLQAQLLEEQITQAQQQTLQIAAQTAFVIQQKLNAQDELLTTSAQRVQIGAQTDLVVQQKANLVDELITAGKQRLQLDQQTINLVTQELQIIAQTELIGQQKQTAILAALNIPKEGLVLDGQKCKLDAEFDLLAMTKIKTETETELLVSKITTERAQTAAIGVDADSVIGRQKALYGAQTSGFTRDAEQKAAKLMVDSWNVRRSTDEGTLANNDNMLSDAAVGRAVNKLLSGVGA